MSQGRLDLALEAARECAELTLPLFRGGVAADLKADGSPVSIADRDCERLLRELIRGRFPDDAIVGEEFGEIAGASGYRWYLDPIDGTKSFVAGVPLWGTLIGIEHAEQIVAGVASLPALGELAYASVGRGAWQIRSPDETPRRARVSQVSRLEDALFCYTSAAGFARREATAALERLSTSCKTSRGWGDCFGWLLVATGRADVMIDTHDYPWDLAPFAVILAEAGGTLADWRGNATIHGGDGVATNEHLRSEVLEMLR